MVRELRLGIRTVAEQHLFTRGYRSDYPQVDPITVDYLLHIRRARVVRHTAVAYWDQQSIPYPELVSICVGGADIGQRIGRDQDTDDFQLVSGDERDFSEQP